MAASATAFPPMEPQPATAGVAPGVLGAAPPQQLAAGDAQAGGFDPALLMSLAQLFAVSQMRGPGATTAQATSLMQVLNHPTIQGILRDPEQVRSLAQNNPLVHLFRWLQQQVGGATQPSAGAATGAATAGAGGAAADAPRRSGSGLPGGAVPGFPQILESLQQTASRGSAAMPGTPCQMVGQWLVQPAVQGLNNISSAAAGGGGRGLDIPLVGPMVGAVAQAASSMATQAAGAAGVAGVGPRGYEAELEQMAAMGFADRAASLRALQKANGNVSRAVESLLQ